MFMLRRTKPVLFGTVTEYLSVDGYWYMQSKSIRRFKTKAEARTEAKNHDPKWGEVMIVGPRGGTSAL